MSLNGIDISSYQKGINLSVVPCDFVIIKATQGLSYVNPDFDRAYKQAKQCGKLLGIYHYANGAGAAKEADFFVNTIGSRAGEAILVLDWESAQNPQFGNSDVTYVKAFCDRVCYRTGVKPLVYMSKSVCRAHNWESVAKDFGLWVAQYANNNTTGYQSKPWTDSKGYGAWKSPVIFQYSSKGRLNGWSGNLDMDIAYLTPEQWAAYAKGNTPKQEEPKAEEPAKDPVLPTLKRGSQGTAVKWLQIALGGLEVDGSFGWKTLNAVVEFQKAHGLEADGIVGPKTWAAIISTM